MAKFYQSELLFLIPIFLIFKIQSHRGSNWCMKLLSFKPVLSHLDSETSKLYHIKKCVCNHFLPNLICNISTSSLSLLVQSLKTLSGHLYNIFFVVVKNRSLISNFRGPKLWRNSCDVLLQLFFSMNQNER